MSRTETKSRAPRSKNRAVAWGLAAAGAAGLLDTGALLAAGGGLNTGILLPGLLGGVLLLMGAALRFQWAVAVSPRWRVPRRVFLACGALWLLSFAAVCVLLCAGAFPPACPPCDWVVVLGAGLHGDRPSETLRRRLETAADYLRENPGARAVVSGGRGPGETITEAVAMRTFLVKAGVAQERILPEDRATSTAENLRNSRAVLEAAGAFATGKPRVAVVTSGFHLFRVRLLARRAGIELLPVAAPTPWYLLPNACLREYLAVVKSLLLDR
ncbi:MAG TPA: YdcF family protein [Candidatus Hydrogenedentes bacterium]|nr:YdcF family protein [Candidatus Hydrogenedentota bacterium]